MKEEFEKQLQNDFIFMRRNTSHSYGKYGCEMLEGWFDLIYSMCAEISAIGGDFIPLQIKQKFGRLRVYYRTGDARVDAIVQKYETLSETICEMCGKSGIYRKELIVLCDDCKSKSDNGRCIQWLI
jgi:hypothetical protein